MKNYKSYIHMFLLLVFGWQSYAQNIIKIPPYLKKGDTVGILATARKVELKSLQPAIKLLKEWGLHVVTGKTIGLDNNQLAGQDWQRATDLQQMLDNPAIKAIWNAKGGYGTVRIIDRVNFTRFRQKPKWIIGFSDTTVLHSHISNFNIVTLHSLMGISVANATPQAIESLRKALFGERLEYTIPAHEFNRAGKATGKLTVGNLSVLYSIAGSVSEADTKGKILFIEDLDEYLYHIDRMMMSLKRSGYFENIKGLVIGGMTKMRDNDIPWGHNAPEIIKDITKEYNIPVCYNFPAGHITDNRALVLGQEATLEVTETGTRLIFK
ncbi:LD-carboxypeptidase [Flavobacterium cyanobacteriorum]|uniref:LD-carboxypeptidase n=1 Tax=Flavobacterium cyanobacteriorum TaxID=2022802 RepID=A0A255Z6T0_9FLAO|nr:LD-carboxypeptidase [Flavobacterium cyanobacteriorum]OYQ37132.1 LD-carboxypeptidase [Flavobacterium cyanobacteriorum]